MRQIIEAYGKFLLDALVVVLLMGFLFATVTDDAGNRGIFQIIGANLETGGNDYSSYTDFDVYEAESKKSAPAITYDASVLAGTGRNRLDSFIRASDDTGKELPFYVTSIQSPGHEELIASYQPDTSEIEFLEPGIYTVELWAVDALYKKTAGRIRIPVNR